MEATTTAPASDLSVSAVDPLDSGALRAFLDLTEEYYSESWPEEMAAPNWRERYESMLVERCRTDPRRWLWVAHSKGQLVGLANFYISGSGPGRIGTIQELYIRPAHRNRHLGAHLFELAKREMSAAGAKRIKASVAVDELGRVKFFEGYGFRIERLSMVLDLDETPAA